MALNCKPGDWAVVVNSTCGNVGKVVQCVKVFTHPAEVDPFFIYRYSTAPTLVSPNKEHELWYIDKPLPCVLRNRHTGEEQHSSMSLFFDKDLRPLFDELNLHRLAEWQEQHKSVAESP